MTRGFFSFEALGGDYPLLGAAIANTIPTAVSGVSDAQKYLIASLCAGRIVYLTADALTAQRAADAIRALSGKQAWNEQNRAVLAARDPFPLRAESRAGHFQDIVLFHAIHLLIRRIAPSAAFWQRKIM